RARAPAPGQALPPASARAARLRVCLERRRWSRGCLCRRVGLEEGAHLLDRLAHDLGRLLPVLDEHGVPQQAGQLEADAGRVSRVIAGHDEKWRLDLLDSVAVGGEDEVAGPHGFAERVELVLGEVGSLLEQASAPFLPDAGVEEARVGVIDADGL